MKKKVTNKDKKNKKKVPKPDQITKEQPHNKQRRKKQHRVLRQKNKSKVRTRILRIKTRNQLRLSFPKIKRSTMGLSQTYKQPKLAKKKGKQKKTDNKTT
jgi:hypothetical protein